MIGMPGSGKSTIGKAVAKRLGRPFLDTDEMIEEKEGSTCAEIILSGGEEAFRRLEIEATAEAGKQTGHVIATGGGVVLKPENFYSLKQNGTIFWITRDVEWLEQQGRPLSADRETLWKLFQQREPLYRKFSDVIVENNGALEDTANLILEEFSRKMQGG